MRVKALGKVSKVLLLSAGILALAYLGGGLVAGWMLVRPSKRRDYDCVPNVRYGKLQELTLFTPSGIRLHAWVLLSRMAAPDNWVLLLHGYRSDRCAVQNRVRFFARRGFNVLLLHFRGHGSSDPALISYGYHEREDVKVAFDFVHSLRPGHRVHIGINGISMGAAAAAYAVGYEGIDPDWMVLESCYDNIQNALTNRLAKRVGNSLVPLLTWPIGLVVEYLDKVRREDLDPAKALGNARCPILMMAGDSEVVLKTVEIEYLYGCIPEPKRLVIFPGAGHEDLLAFDPKRYARSVGSFLRDFVPRSQRPGSSATGASQPPATPQTV